MPITYENDFYGWTQEQANLLRKGRLKELDTQNLLEEIEAMGRSEKRELASRLEVLFVHLLKWQYQSERQGRSWILTIEEQRRKVERIILENPSLKNRLQDTIEQSYGDAIIQAEKETNIRRTIFPEACPWTFKQIMDTEFLPE